MDGVIRKLQLLRALQGAVIMQEIRDAGGIRPVLSATPGERAATLPLVPRCGNPECKKVISANKIYCARCLAPAIDRVVMGEASQQDIHAVMLQTTREERGRIALQRTAEHNSRRSEQPDETAVTVSL